VFNNFEENMIKNFFRSPEAKALNYANKTLNKINSFENLFVDFTDEQLKEKTNEFKSRLSSNQDTLDSLLPEAFALVREVSKRVLNQRHYDVQLLGGFVLHKGKIAEMKTGEGKTLVSVLAGYLNSLEGKGVHIVTVNPYLAKRDSEEMGKIYRFLNQTVGCVVPDMEFNDKQAAYNCDITYITHSELGFDHLRDNMKKNRSEMFQRDLNFAIVDEVDSILIDEARTPLIISGEGVDLSTNVICASSLIDILNEEDDYELDIKSKNVHLNEKGLLKIEAKMVLDNMIVDSGNLYDDNHLYWMAFIEQALKAKHFYNLNKEYVINNEQINIVDEHTGRVLSGRRYGRGLHQAIEAKEGLKIQVENRTQAIITYQNFFKMYKKLSGMTGTAYNDREEFGRIYGLEVVPIKTNKPIKRLDKQDLVYKTIKEKDNAIINRILDAYKVGQPVLVGTESVDKSIQISEILNSKKIPHNVLNAKYHDMEADIIAQAGRPYAITITTNMAGRGTDIKLGGNFEILKNSVNEEIEDEKNRKLSILKEEVERDEALAKDLGGLLVIGTSRHDSRRIDLQLKGRSGRQGDPGETVFMISAEDELILRFGSKLKEWLNRVGLPDGVPISHKFISKSVATAQRKVEEFYSEKRKDILEYDNVIDLQRKAFYKERLSIIDDQIDMLSVLEYMDNKIMVEILDVGMPKNSFPEQWDLKYIENEIFEKYSIRFPVVSLASKEGVNRNLLEEQLQDGIKEYRQWKLFELNNDEKNKILKEHILNIMDEIWKEHLIELDYLKEGIGLRSYGQKNPLYEWAKDASRYFLKLHDYIALEFVKKVSLIDFRKPNGLYEVLKNDKVSEVNKVTFNYNVVNKIIDLSKMSSNPFWGYQNIV
jgi:preprotein translocase subunit SecA